MMVVGGRHAHTEFYNFQSNAWSQGPDYPYSSYINASPICYYQNMFVLFGKDGVIAAFDMFTKQWSQIGSTIVSERSYHNAIQLLDSSFLIFGGHANEIATEKCSWKEKEIQCSTQEPTVTMYAAFPELFHVSDNYCQ